MISEKYFFCDIDGTISTDENVIDDEVRSLINQEEEVNIILATGRNQSYVKSLGLNVDAICSNGCEIVYKDGHCEKNAYLTIEQSIKIVEILNDISLPYLFVTEIGNLLDNKINIIDTVIELAKMHGSDPKIFMVAIQSYYDSLYKSSIIVDNCIDFVKENNLTINKIEIFTSLDKEILKEEFSNIKGINVFSSHMSYLEIVPTNGTKKEAIKKYLEGIDTKKKIYAIGDEVNDIDMLKFADYSFAVKNANMEVLKIVDHIVGGVNENGFVDALKYIKLDNLKEEKIVNKKNDIELQGGRIGKIHKVDDTVVRPSNEWTETVHKFLKFMHDKGADFVPIPYGIEGNNEIISFMPGEVFNDPLPEIFNNDSMIISAALLLAKFHKISEQFIPYITKECKWMLSPIYPAEVICHGDYAPYNVVIVDDKVKSLIDFDTIHPGTKLWDISYALYRWVPFIDKSEDVFNESMRKMRLFLDIYGLEENKRDEVVQVMIDRLTSLTNFMKSEAEAGNIDFQRNIDDGHLQKYIDDIEYLKKNEGKIIYGIKK